MKHFLKKYTVLLFLACVGLVGYLASCTEQEQHKQHCYAIGNTAEQCEMD